jgi:competence ComEA-like helix-hairpin-helix protein
MNRTAQDSTQSFAFVIGAFAAIGLCCGFASSPEANDSVPRPYAVELDSQINPNDASVESMARLPGLGPARAGAIVAYRQDHPDSRAFRDGKDLQNVSGIGPGTVESIDDWIKFE